MGDEPRKTPLFQSIAVALRGEIAAGAYPPGSRLPTEARLAERFGVNRHTVRHALSLLTEEGLVRGRRGSGTVVLARPIDYPIGPRVRFHQNLVDAGRSPEKKVLSVEIRAATAEDAELLAVPLGSDVVDYTSLSFDRAVPVALTRSRFPECRLPGLAAALRETSSVTAALAKVGVKDYVRRETRVTAELADAVVAAQLTITEGAPLIVSSALSTDRTGAPVEHGRTRFAGSRVTLTFDHSKEGARTVSDQSA